MLLGRKGIDKRTKQRQRGQAWEVEDNGVEEPDVIGVELLGHGGEEEEVEVSK